MTEEIFNCASLGSGLSVCRDLSFSPMLGVVRSRMRYDGDSRDVNDKADGVIGKCDIHI